MHEGNLIKWHNEAMIEKMLDYFNMSDCKPASTPLTPSLDFMSGSSSELTDHTPYRQLVGTLMGFANTVQPEICYAVNYLAPYMDKSNSALWMACKHVLRNLRGTPSLGLLYKLGDEMKLQAYSDSEWAQEQADRKIHLWTLFHDGQWHGELAINETGSSRPEPKKGRTYRLSYV